MEFFGDVERAFATSLYPLRIPIAIALLVGLIAMIVVARRRGWVGAARRQPRRAAVLAVAILAVGLPVGWYLGSPLFIRTSLVEPAPSAAQAPSPSPSIGLIPTASAAAVTPPVATANPLATAPPLAATRTGTFEGADDFHFGSGTAKLIETAPGVWTVRFEDFSVRNGPDLYVYLSPDRAGYAEGAVELGTLKATDGDFNTSVPAGTVVTGLRSVVIWCKQFGVQFAVATLT